jgi:hypothetical protein
VLLLALAWLGVARPDLFPGAAEAPQFAYLLMALLLVSGAAWGFARIRMAPAAALAGAVFWAAFIVLLMLVYSWFN